MFAFSLQPQIRHRAWVSRLALASCVQAMSLAAASAAVGHGELTGSQIHSTIVGKYVTDDVYVEIIGGGREGPAAQVEWRIRRALSLVSRLGGEGDAKLSVKWRKDYR